MKFNLKVSYNIIYYSICNLRGVLIMDIILSLYPENIEKIALGIKKFEFRRSIYKDKTVKKVYIYATVPIKK